MASGRAAAMREQKHSNVEAGPENLNLASVLRESLVCAVLAVDPHRRVNLLAGEAEEILGIRADPSKDLFLEELPGAIRKPAREAMESGIATLNREIELGVSGKQARNLQLSAVPVRPGTKNSGVTLVLRQVTSPPWVEHDLRRLDRLASIGTLAAGMAHEIKNALVAG